MNSILQGLQDLVTEQMKQITIEYNEGEGTEYGILVSYNGGGNGLGPFAIAYPVHLGPEAARVVWGHHIVRAFKRKPMLKGQDKW